MTYPHQTGFEGPNGLREGRRGWQGSYRNFQGKYSGLGKGAPGGQQNPTGTDVKGRRKLQEVATVSISTSNEYWNREWKARIFSPIGEGFCHDGNRITTWHTMGQTSAPAFRLNLEYLSNARRFVYTEPFK